MMYKKKKKQKNFEENSCIIYLSRSVLLWDPRALSRRILWDYSGNVNQPCEVSRPLCWASAVVAQGRLFSVYVPSHSVLSHWAMGFLPCGSWEKELTKALMKK